METNDGVINWTRSLTFEDACNPASLNLSLRHDGSKAVDETYDGQSGMLQVGGKDVLVQTHAVPGLVYGVARYVRKIIVVTCGEHDCIYL